MPSLPLTKRFFSLSRQPAAQNLLKTCLVFCSNPFSSSECENIFIVLNDGQINDQAGVVKVYFLEKQKVMFGKGRKTNNLYNVM